MQVLFVLFSLIAAALAQRISLGSPSAGQTLSAGQSTTVQVFKPDSLSGSTEIGIAITLQKCSQTPCPDESQTLGNGGNAVQPFQNFTVTVPSGFSGPAVLSVAHANLIGAGPSLFTEITNVTVTVT
ncbi:hypothetical protein DFH11DRAFT_1608864 [Phellopilus nigrolimitatus]|nr:hypothetical protein DFH11DRAFT_1608864 [Phellopilus nigrolimitatus]